MNIDWIARLPKFDLHVHLDGSLRPETVAEFAEEPPVGKRFPSSLNVQRAVVPPQRCSLETYLRAFKITVALLQTQATLERAAYELCEDAAKENVIYLEIRFAPLLHLREGLTPARVVEAVLSGMNRAKKTYSIRTGLILCAMKQESPEKALEVARLAAQYVDRGVVAIDLAGPERNFPPSRHRQAIEIAREADLHVTIHAGEGCCPEQIKEAIDLGADRIGHGVYLYQDKKTECRVAELGIPLEICPTSNLQISGIMNTYADHPLKRYLDRGIRVTLNTDNRLMSQTNSTNELEQVINAFALAPHNVKQVLNNSARAAFVPEESQLHFLATIDAAFA